MILQILLCFIIIRLLYKSFEPMTCKNVTIEDSPITSLYNLVYNAEKDTYTNNVFDTQYKQYKIKLKKYFEDIETYCNS